MLDKIDIEQCKRTAEERGGQCLSMVYINSTTKLHWRCKKGHDWNAVWNNVRRGKWCPECNYEQRRGKQDTEEIKEKKHNAWRTSEKVKEMLKKRYEARFKRCSIAAENHGGKCLEIWPVKGLTLTWWGRFICNHSHVWTTRIDSIFEHWCKKCSYGTRSIEQCRTIAEERNYEYLSHEAPRDHHQQLKWKCNYCGCEWQVNLNNFLRGHGCPNCRRHYHDMENRTRVILENIFHKPFNSCKPFKNIGSLLEVDGYNNELNLAFEYDGIQHRTKKFFMRQEIDPSIFERDREKDALCKKNNIRLIRITDLEATRETLVDVIIKKLGESSIAFSILPDEILSKLRNSLDPIYKRVWGRKHLQKFRETCNSHIDPVTGQRGELLSNGVWNGTIFKYDIRCEHNHIFNGDYVHIVSRNHWCSICAGQQPIGIERCRQLALERGGECLSTEYINSLTKLHWKCSKGHKWDATWNSIQRRSWCPICYSEGRGKSQRLDINVCKEHATKMGGNCLSIEYTNNHTKLHWQCARGHEWYAGWSNIKQGHWCPKCGYIKRGLSRRLGIEVCKEYAIKMGGECLSNEYINNKTKLRWRCLYNHEWDALWGNIQQGKWCPKCAHRGHLNPKTIEKMQVTHTGRWPNYLKDTTMPEIKPRVQVPEPRCRNRTLSEMEDKTEEE